MAVSRNPARFRDFVRELADLVERGGEAEILLKGAALLGGLVATDDWLPADCAQPDPNRYCQYLLHCDSRERFSVVSFVWGQGQSTSIHNHTVWGLVGVLRGAEMSQPFHIQDGPPQPAGPAALLRSGEVEAIAVGRDLHKVSNADPTNASVSIHVYGGNIGLIQRTSYDAGGTPSSFISGYSKDQVPNFWGP